MANNLFVPLSLFAQLNTKAHQKTQGEMNTEMILFIQKSSIQESPFLTSETDIAFQNLFFLGTLTKYLLVSTANY